MEEIEQFKINCYINGIQNLIPSQDGWQNGVVWRRAGGCSGSSSSPPRHHSCTPAGGATWCASSALCAFPETADEGGWSANSSAPFYPWLSTYWYRRMVRFLFHCKKAKKYALHLKLNNVFLVKIRSACIYPISIVHRQERCVKMV